MRFDVSLLYLGHFVFCFEDFVSFGKAFVDIPNVDADVSRKIFIRV